MVTDLDILVSLGYEKELSRRALAEAKGDRAAALEYIRTNGNGSSSGGRQENKEWKTYKSESDWKNNITAQNVPKDSAMRALWKSPITVHINSFLRSGDGQLLFKCRVITHAKGWVCNRSIEDFMQFKSSLPVGGRVGGLCNVM